MKQSNSALKEDRSIADKLKEISIFDPIKEELQSLEALGSLMTVKKFRTGQTIIKEGEEGTELFVLFSGSVEIMKNTLDKERYTVTELTAENNTFFGELALIDNERRSATVVAKTECELLVLDKASFVDLGNKDYRLGLLITRRISQLLAQRLRRANQDMITLFEALVGEIEEGS